MSDVDRIDRRACQIVEAVTRPRLVGAVSRPQLVGAVSRSRSGVIEAGTIPIRRQRSRNLEIAPTSFVGLLALPLALLLTLCSAANLSRADDAGLAKLIYTRGPTATEGTNGAIRIVGLGSSLQAGDLISTGEESFAIIELPDTTRVMLRPDTAVRLAVLRGSGSANGATATPTNTAAAATAQRTAQRDGVSLQLDRGGIRAQGPKVPSAPTSSAAATTGASANDITAANTAASSAATTSAPLRLQVVTADATVSSANGADFIARTCNVDCAAERSTMRKVTTPSSSSVARALVVSGDVSIASPDGVSRSIAKGATMNVGDVISTAANAHAVIAFRDSTRVTIEPSSAFKVEAYRLAPQQPQTEVAHFRLQHGGMRAATGDIGHRRLTSMRFATPVATVGIRGTGFDVVESKTCGGQSAKGKPAMTAAVWTGAIVLQESNTVINKGEAVCQFDAGGKVYKAAPPKLDTPRPDEVGIPQNTFDALSANGDEAGTHVTSMDGDLTVSNNNGNVFLSTGEDGFASNLTNVTPSRTQNTISLGRADPFLTLDLGSKPDQFDAFQPVFSTQCTNGG